MGQLERPALQELHRPDGGAAEAPHLAEQHEVHQSSQCQCSHLWLQAGNESPRRPG